MTSAELRILVKDSAMTPEQKAAIGLQLATNPTPIILLHPQDAGILPPQPSPLESKFAIIWQSLNGPPLEAEYKFLDNRKFRFDFAHPITKTAIECEGGSYKGIGRHFTPKGFVNDAIKYNLAAMAGWCVFRLPGQLIDEENIRPIVERIRNDQ